MGERVKASPLARRIAQEQGVDLAGLTGSGPGGRIVKADVERRAGSRAAVAAAHRRSCSDCSAGGALRRRLGRAGETAKGRPPTRS